MDHKIYFEYQQKEYNKGRKEGKRKEREVGLEGGKEGE